MYQLQLQRRVEGAVKESKIDFSEHQQQFHILIEKLLAVVTDLADGNGGPFRSSAFISEMLAAMRTNAMAALLFECNLGSPNTITNLVQSYKQAMRRRIGELSTTGRQREEPDETSYYTKVASVPKLPNRSRVSMTARARRAWKEKYC